jgi:hypothetical protein
MFNGRPISWPRSVLQRVSLPVAASNFEILIRRADAHVHKQGHNQTSKTVSLLFCQNFTVPKAPTKIMVVLIKVMK